MILFKQQNGALAIQDKLMALFIFLSLGALMASCDTIDEDDDEKQFDVIEVGDGFTIEKMAAALPIQLPSRGMMKEICM